MVSYLDEEKYPTAPPRGGDWATPLAAKAALETE